MHVSRSSGVGLFAGGAQRTAAATYASVSSSPSSMRTDSAWFAKPVRCNEANRKSPERSPVKTRPVRLPPWAAGARPTISMPGCRDRRIRERAGPSTPRPGTRPASHGPPPPATPPAAGTAGTRRSPRSARRDLRTARRRHGMRAYGRGRRYPPAVRGTAPRQRDGVVGDRPQASDDPQAPRRATRRRGRGDLAPRSRHPPRATRPPTTTSTSWWYSRATARSTKPPTGCCTPTPRSRRYRAARRMCTPARSGSRPTPSTRPAS